ncbi:hypothetical protein HZB01_03670 [Candidatus Woesearchaeota archaeon]|nr:hypothetical protein [Candidatus Woesearchaeota archaeon]
MEIERVVFTYGTSRQVYRSLTDRLSDDPLGSTPLSQAESNLQSNLDMMTHTDRSIITGLSRAGVSVTELPYRKIAAMSRAEFSELLGEADLVFFDSSRFARELYFEHAPVDSMGISSRWFPGDFDMLIELSYEGSGERNIGDVVQDMVLTDHLAHAQFLSPKIQFTTKRKAREIAQAAGIPVPQGWEVDEFLAGSFALPVVLKHTECDGGSGVYFIEDIDQLKRFFDPEIYAQLDFEGAPNTRDYILEQFIETPSQRFTHYRIYTVGNGAVIGAVLAASSHGDDERIFSERRYPLYTADQAYGQTHLPDHSPNPLYMGFKKITSNKKKGESRSRLLGGAIRVH